MGGGIVRSSAWPGAIWLSVVAIYIVAVPLVLLGTRTARAVTPVSP